MIGDSCTFCNLSNEDKNLYLHTSRAVIGKEQNIDSTVLLRLA